MSKYSDHDFGCPSPYPPSSPSIDSSDDERYPPSANLAFRSSLASVPESTLRAIMAKLADGNPRFYRAIMKELTHATETSPPTTPTRSKPRKSERRKGRRNCKGLSVATDPLPVAHNRPLSSSSESALSPDESVYHPGQLDEEVYEFLHRTEDEVTYNVVRKIAMWSCCNEDEWSPGCAVASSFPLPVGHPPAVVDFSHPDVFPDSDLEQTYEGERTLRISVPGMLTRNSSCSC